MLMVAASIESLQRRLKIDRRNGFTFLPEFAEKFNNGCRSLKLIGPTTDLQLKSAQNQSGAR